MPQLKSGQPPLRCYRCGESLAALSLPLARLDQCPACSVDLHVCRMCTHYAPGKPDACDEEDAIEVANKTAANFCDYFAPDPDVFSGREQRAEDAARRQLDALFGGDAGKGAGKKASGDGAPGAGGKAAGAGSETSADAALEAAEKLFRK